MTATAQVDDLLDKLRRLSTEQLAEVATFVDFLTDRQRKVLGGVHERLREAARAGRIMPPSEASRLSSVIDHPPVVVPGKPASEIVIEDRR